MKNALSGLFGNFGIAGELLCDLVEEIGKSLELSQEQKDTKIESLRELYDRLNAANEIAISMYEAANPEGERYWELAGFDLERDEVGEGR